MNKIYKVIWDPATGSYKVASETAKSRGKKTGCRKLALSALIGLSSIMSAGNALANAGNDTGTGITTPGDPGTGNGWIAIGTGAEANTYTSVDGASAALGYFAKAAGHWSTAIGSYSKSEGDASLALGVHATSAGDRGIALGASSNAAGSYSMALGVTSEASGANSVALGRKAKALGDKSVALGLSAITESDNSIALGTNAATTSIATNSVALGNSSKASAVSSIAIGDGAQASGDYSIALGANSSVTGNNSVAIGDGSTTGNDNTVSVGNDTTQRKITFMGKGAISKTSTDAVNGSQIYSLSSSIATRLGGGSAVDPDGTVTAPKYVLSHGTYNNVGAALGAIDSTVNNMGDTVTGLTEDALLWDSKGAFSASHGTSTTNKITNIAAGDLNAGSTDAVNGSQLFETNQNVTQNQTDIKQNKTDIAANTTSIDQNKTNIATNTSNINQNKTDIAANTTRIDQNKTDIATNSTNISTNTTNIAALDTSVTALTNDALLWDENSKAFSADHGTNTTSKITNVTAGNLSANSTDAVNGSQLFETEQKVTQNEASIAANTSSIDQNKADIATNTSSIDQNKTDIAANTTSIDQNKTDIAANTTSIDQNKTEIAANTAGIDQNKTDIAANTTSIDQNKTDIAANSTNISTNTTNIANLDTSVTALTNDALLWDEGSKAFSAGHGTNTTSKITNVTAGNLSANSTDAVNGSQLFETEQKVTQNEADIAANTTSIDQNKTDIAANTTSIDQNKTDIATNTASIDQNKTDIAANTTNITTNTANIAALDTSVTALTNDALLWDEGSKAFSADHGTNTTSKITNITAGDLNANSSDAVNGSQLFETNQNVTQNTTNIAQNTTDIKNLNTSVTDINTSITNLGNDSVTWDDASKAFSASHGTDATSKITNVTAGTLAADSTDAVNGSQLFETNQNVAQNTTNITQNTTDIENLNTSVTDINTSITGLTDDALLWDAASNAFSASHGTNATSKITNVTAGTLAADSTDAVNGSQLFETNQAVEQNTANITQNTTDIAQNTTNIENLNTSVTDINTSITGLTDNALLWDDVANAFSASHGTNLISKITNVAAGVIAADSTDAVNGSQLFETNQNVEQNTTNIAQNTTNIENLNTSVTDINTSITGLTDNSLLWDATADNGNGAFSASHGTNATNKITNVAVGDLNADSTDAVNGSQLYETNQNVTKNTLDIENINTSITNLGSDALKWDDATGSFSASHGTEATSKISNVAKGEVVADGTDAVNGGQLYDTNQLIAQNSEAISNIAGDTSETYITNNGAGVNYVRTNDTGLVADDAHASGVGATAVGYNAVASGAGSLAMGKNSSSSVDTGIALGSGSTSNRAISAGTQSTSVSRDGVVTVGYDTTDRTLLGALSLGTDGESYRQITNVADGSESQDAVTVRQLQNAISAVSSTSTKYFHANSDEGDSLAVGANSIAVGAKTVVNGDAGIGIGYGSSVDQAASNGIAMGTNAMANHADSVAIGSNSKTTVGAQSSYTAYNMDAPQSSIGEVSVGNAEGQRQITNVAAGTLDTDAVNVAQLKVTDSRVTANTQSINNLNTQVSNIDTRVTTLENSFGDIVTTGSTKYFKTNATGADANAQGTDSVAMGSGSIASAENSVAIGTNSVADEANTVSVGSSTQQRRITNVSAGVNSTDAVNVAQLKSSEAGSVRYATNTDGSVNYSVLNLGDGSGSTTRISNVSAAVNDTDAVNYAQLKQSVESANTYTDQRMGEMNSKIKGVEDKMSGGIASAMAMAGLPQAYAPGASMTSLAGGTYNGESAIALGVSMVSASGTWVYKLQGTSNSQGDYSAAIGAGIQW